MGFALVGGLTGTGACAFPPELNDLTSATVIELARRPRKLDSLIELELSLVRPSADENLVRRALDEIKSRSRLTWGQIAGAMDVDTRTIHLWRAGKGISANHQERLQELIGLINSIDLGDASETQAQLLESTPGGSLLDRLRAGASPRNLSRLAPWRTEAAGTLARNIDELRTDGILDEDFAFLWNMGDTDIEPFAARANALLDDAGARRRDWEQLLARQISMIDRPEVRLIDDDLTDPDDDFGGIRPLFSLDELGIELGVGSIASSRPLHEWR